MKWGAVGVLLRGTLQSDKIENYNRESGCFLYQKSNSERKKPL